MAEHGIFLAELHSLWYQLAGNPYNRALVVARLLKNHQADSATTQIFTDLISRQTSPSQERDQALALIAPASLFPPIEIVPEQETTYLRVDAELGRLAISLSRAAEFRLWIVGRDITRCADGSGIITKKALKARLAALGVGYTPRHYNRLLAQGTGLFWHLSGSQIYLRSVVKVAGDLVQASPIHDNYPGVRDVYLDVSGTLEQWEAMLYAGWIAHRGYSHDITIARETQATLFNRHENTIRRWEQTRLAQVISKRTNYAQCPDFERYYPYIPDHSQAYVARVSYKGKVQEEIRLRWQLPNSYHAGIKHHEKRGQALKVRKAVNAQYPASEKRGGQCVRYLSSQAKLKRLHQSLKFRMGLLGDVEKPVYVYIGEHYRTKHGMYEVNNSGFIFTHPNERIAPDQERKVLGNLIK